jgi:endonuclease/exonuclease/phosphatase (EEP) superfamily protein YafD
MHSVARRAVKMAVATLGLLTLVGLFDRYSPYLELATFFRLQYAILLGAAALAALLLRLFPTALAALLLVGVNLLLISPGATPATGPVGSAGLRLLIINLQHGNDEHESVARLIADTDPDVIGLTELTPAWMSGLKSALASFPSRRLETQEGAYGIGLYSKLPLPVATIERFPADGPPSVVATIALGQERLTLVLTHVHTPFAGSIHGRQLQALGEARKRLEEPLAICGDFNAVPWSQSIRHLAATAGLRSIHRSYGLQGTWPSQVLVLRIPIDNCLISDGLTVLDRHVGLDIGSDHLPLMVDLGIEPTAATVPRGLDARAGRD